MNDLTFPKTFLIILILTSLGALLRLDFLFASHFVIDSDEAIVGLMAKHINEGKDFPIFFYGQSYMGSFEAIIAAIFFYLFGISSFILKLVPFFFSILIIPLTYAIAVSCIPMRAALIATMLVALPPNSLVVWSGMARGGYMEIIVLGELSILILFKWMQEKAHCQLRIFLLGLVLGFGWWTNNQILYFIPAIALGIFGTLFWDKLRSLKEILITIPLGILSFFIGSLPYWVFNLSTDFSSFKMLDPVRFSDFLSHLYGIIRFSLPILIGAEHSWTKIEIFPLSTLIITMCVGALFFAGCVSREKNKILLSIVIFTALLTVAWSPYGFHNSEPRYLLAIYPFVAIIVASSVEILLTEKKWLGIFVSAFLIFSNFISSYSPSLVIPNTPVIFKRDRVATDHTELISWLHSHNITFVKTNYWIGYRLAFETEEKIKFLIFQDPEVIRISSYEIEGGAFPESKIPYILTQSQAILVERSLTLLGYNYKKDSASGYIILFDLQPKNFPTATILDQNYYSVTALQTGKFVVWKDIEFNSPQNIDGITLTLAKDRLESLQRLSIDVVNSQGVSQTIMSKRDFGSLSYLNRDATQIFLPLHLEQIVKLSLRHPKKSPLPDWGGLGIRFEIHP